MMSDRDSQEIETRLMKTLGSKFEKRIQSLENTVAQHKQELATSRNQIDQLTRSYNESVHIINQEYQTRLDRLVAENAELRQSHQENTKLRPNYVHQQEDNGPSEKREPFRQAPMSYLRLLRQKSRGSFANGPFQQKGSTTIALHTLCGLTQSTLTNHSKLLSELKTKVVRHAARQAEQNNRLRWSNEVLSTRICEVVSEAHKLKNQQRALTMLFLKTMGEQKAKMSALEASYNNQQSIEPNSTPIKDIEGKEMKKLRWWLRVMMKISEADSASQDGEMDIDCAAENLLMHELLTIEEAESWPNHVEEPSDIELPQSEVSALEGFD